MEKIAVINDISGLGRCSLGAQLPVLSVLGFEVCPILTAALTCQTGYESFHIEDLSRNMENYISDWKKAKVQPSALLTGFFLSGEQVKKGILIADSFNKDCLTVVDPIAGDGGKIFPCFNNSYLREIRELIKRAHIITPNLTELSLILNKDYERFSKNLNLNERDYGAFLMEEAMDLLIDKMQYIIVKGVRLNTGDNTVYNYILSREGFSYTKHNFYKSSYSGTGDIFVAIVTGLLLKGKDIHYAVKTAGDFIEKSVSESADTDSKSGINFQSSLKLLLTEY